MNNSFTANLTFASVYYVQVTNPLSINPTKWSNTLKQFVGYRWLLALNRANAQMYP